MGLLCPPIQSEFLSIVSILIPLAPAAFKERTAHWVSSLLEENEAVTQLG